MDALAWLLAGDPAIRWQALRDLAGASAARVKRERRRVAREGWGARLLALQDATGLWGGGLYTPKWTSTTYTLLLLRDFGLEPGNRRAALGCRRLLDGGFYRDAGINFFPGSWRYSETCVTGMALSLVAYFGLDDARLDSVLDHLLSQQMRDGGWNCRRPKGATHASFHTTISVLEGLRDYERLGRCGAARAREAAARGREFLLAHRLYRSHRTGEVVSSALTRFQFPPRWHYDVLRALDHFREAGAPRDARLEDAVALVRARSGTDGRWLLPGGYPGRVFFPLETRGEPSRWNTLRALRVLAWWEGG